MVPIGIHDLCTVGFRGNCWALWGLAAQHTSRHRPGTSMYIRLCLTPPILELLWMGPKSPVITWVQALGSFVVLGKRIFQKENQGFSQRGTSLATSLRVHEINTAALLLSLSNNTRAYQRVPA